MLNVRKVWFSANFSDAINVQNNLDIFSDLISFLITVLISVSCDHVTSFNYDDKEARDVGPTCGSHLRIIMADSISHEKTWDRDNLFLFFCFFVFVFVFSFCLFVCLNVVSFSFVVILQFSSGSKIWNQFYHSIISDILWQMGLVNLQWSLKSEGISDEEFNYGVLLSLYVALFSTRDDALLFNAICLRVVANGFLYNLNSK